MNLRMAALVVAAACVLSACGNGGGDAQSTVDQFTASKSGSVTSSAPPEKKLHIVESGFGQKGEYAWVTALVHNDAAKVGDFVVVNFYLKGASGQIIQSESQTEQFYKDGQDLAVGTQVSVSGGKKAAQVEATAATTINMPLETTPELALGEVKISESYGDYEGKFEVTNPTGEAVQGARLGVICKDGARVINGGGSTYPDLVPPNGKLLADVSLLVSAKPGSCKAYYGGTM